MSLLASDTAPRASTHHSGTYVARSRVSGDAMRSGDGLDVLSVDSCGIAHNVVDITGDDDSTVVKNPARVLEMELSAKSGLCLELFTQLDDLKHASDGKIAELSFDKDELGKRADKLTNKLAELNAKVAEHCTSARLAARERGRRDQFYAAQADFFATSFDANALEVAKLKGEVAALKVQNSELLLPQKKRARHGAYLGDEFLPLSWQF